MKKIFKFLGIGLGALLGLVFIAATALNVKPLPNYQEAFPVEELQVELSPQRISNGAEISAVLCNHCHGDKGKLEGKWVITEAPFGEIHAPNITQDETFGIGSYTDGELYRLLRTGIKKDGSLAVPMMMRFPTAADEDIYSIIAYLRSDAKAVQASQKEIPSYDAPFLAKLIFNLALKPMPLPKEAIPKPQRSDKGYGQYLANSLYACYDCHSSSFESNDFVSPENSAGFLGGGNPIAVGEMAPVISPNLTMHEEEGIGSWTSEEFLAAVKYGKKPDGSKLAYPMLPYAFLDSSDIYAIHDYLKTVPVLPKAEGLASLE
ncbi:MAG: cytochrome c [Bacteroidota bacterium]